MFVLMAKFALKFSRKSIKIQHSLKMAEKFKISRFARKVQLLQISAAH